MATGTRGGSIAASVLLGLAVALALVWVFLAPGEKRVLTDDERDYAQAAIHLARHGVFSHAAGLERPAPDAFREPGYSAFVAALWTVARVDLPLRVEELAAGDGRARAAIRPVLGMQRLLLVLAALGAAAGVLRLGGHRLSAVATFALVAASPCLVRGADLFASEALAAPLLVGLALALVALVERPSTARALAAGSVAGALALVRAMFLPLSGAIALALLFLLARRRAGLRLRIAGCFAAAALALPAIWIGRNAILFGHATLADRGGVVLWTRAELGADVDREGLGAAFAAWTPWPLGSSPSIDGSRLGRWRWRDPDREGSPFVRAMARRAALIGQTGDPLAADRRLTQEAFGAIAGRPGRYLVATVPVAWRSLFVERSPAWLHPFDLALPLGLLVALGVIATLVRALRTSDHSALAFLLPALAAFAFAVLATEGLPRFQQPSLPVLWTCTVLMADRWLAARRG